MGGEGVVKGDEVGRPNMKYQDKIRGGTKDKGDKGGKTVKGREANHKTLALRVIEGHTFISKLGKE